MKALWLLGMLGFGSLMACMVPDVTKKSDDTQSCAESAEACGTGTETGSTSKPLTSKTGTAVTADEATTTKPAKHVADAGVDASAASSSTGDDDDTTTTTDDSDAGTTDTTPSSCAKLLDCCVALRNAGLDSDADACDTTYDGNDDLACFDAQDGYANPSDGTVGVCDQP